MSNERIWLSEYFDRYKKSLFNDTVADPLIELKEFVLKSSSRGGKVIIIGNGGSASIASHVAVDLTKNAKTRAISFDDSAFVTCLANDYGFENWIAKALEMHADKNDVVIFISSSGSSKNILNGVKASRNIENKVITFSGFKPDNPLRSSGDLNFWVDSTAYNIVEMTHHIWLLALVDLIIGNAEYSAS